MIQASHKMSDILFEMPRLLLVLERFEMKLGYGDQTVEEVCEAYGINSRLFLSIANLFCTKERLVVQSNYFSVHDLPAILTFLKNSHVYFLDEKIPRLRRLMDDKLLSAPEEKYARLIKKFLDDYASEVFDHMTYENKTVFPYVETVMNKQPGRASYSMKQFKEHHTDIEVKLEDLKNLLLRHMPPEYDFQFRRKLLFELFDLENDIAIHDYIENHLLIPIVEILELEQS